MWIYNQKKELQKEKKALLFHKCALPSDLQQALF